jgi:hypothetical protein
MIMVSSFLLLPRVREFVWVHSDLAKTLKPITLAHSPSFQAYAEDILQVRPTSVIDNL